MDYIRFVSRRLPFVSCAGSYTLARDCPCQPRTRNYMTPEWIRNVRSGGLKLTLGLSLQPQTTNTRHLMQNFQVRRCDEVGLAISNGTTASRSSPPM